MTMGCWAADDDARRSLSEMDFDTGSNESRRSMQRAPASVYGVPHS